MRELASKPNATLEDEREWRSLAQEFSNLIQELDESDEEIFADDLRRGHVSQSELPQGKITFSELRNLLLIYRKPGQWENIANGVQGRLVCRTCAIGWNKLFLDGELDWNLRESRPPRPGNHFILGTQVASGNSCNIYLNVGGFAGHPSAPGSLNGYRCNGATLPNHANRLGFSLTLRDGEVSWSNILFFPKLDASYDRLNRITRGFEELLAGDCRYESEKIEDWSDYVDIGNLTSPNSVWERANTYFNFNRFVNDRVIFLEGLLDRRDEGGRTVYFLPLTQKRIYIQQKALYSSHRTLGLFMLVRGPALVGNEDLQGFFTRLPTEISEELITRMGWSANGGFLYKFESKFFDTHFYEQLTSIDLNEARGVPLLRELREENPQFLFPTIQTNLKRINIFRYQEQNEILERIYPHSQSTTNYQGYPEKLLIHISGFAHSAQRTIKVTILRKRDMKKAKSYPEVGAYPMPGNFATFDLPMGSSQEYKIEISINDGKNQNEWFYLTTRRTHTNQVALDELQLSQNNTENSEILRAFNIQKIQENLRCSPSEAENIVSEPAYFMELVKLLLQDKDAEFSLPTSKLKQYIGFDYLSFPHQENEYQLADRLRSSGIYHPVPAIDPSSGSNSSWDAFEPHLVKLNDDVHLLMTPHTLSYYRISLKDQRFARGELHWSNHGTFIRGHIPREFERIPVVERPQFLNLYSNSPKEHIDTLMSVLEQLNPENKDRYKSEIESNFRVTHEYTDSMDGNRIGRVNKRNECQPEGRMWKRRREPTLLIEYTNVSECSLKYTKMDGKVVYCDLLYATRTNDAEKRILFRVNHENGTKEYLTIARYIQQDMGYWNQEQLEWMTDLRTERDNALADLYRYVGGKFSSFNQIRAYDWSFIEIETLRAFAILYGFRRNTEDEFHRFSSMWPLPLRKFLLGAGRWIQDRKIRTDPMGGAYKNRTRPLPADIEDALKNAVHRWIWLDQNHQ